MSNTDAVIGCRSAIARVCHSEGPPFRDPVKPGLPARVLAMQAAGCPVLRVSERSGASALGFRVSLLGFWLVIFAMAAARYGGPESMIDG